MTLVLLTGGARSGKSALAVDLAAHQDGPVVLLATGQAGDEEMAQRIARHRAERPPHWTTVEEPLALERAITATDPRPCLVIDCLSLWVANAMGAPGSDDAAVQRDGARAAAAAAARPGLTIAVTNEVGLGLVPAHPLGRRYRDVLGRVNAAWSVAADRAHLVVAGRVLALAAAATVLEDLDA